MRRLKKIIIGLVVFLILFVVTGFFVIPHVVKSVLIKKLSQELHRDVSVEVIQFNPFRFCLTVKGFLIRERDKSETFVSFRELFLNLEGLSLLKRAIIVDEVTLTAPYIHVSRDKDGSYNFSDLLTGKKEDKKDQVVTPLRFSFNNITLTDGKVVFRDEPRGARHLAEKIQIGLPFISNMGYDTDNFVKPALSAVINGTPYDLQGRSKPFKDTRQTEFEIKIKDLDVPYYVAYIPGKLNFRLISAALDVDAKLTFRREVGKKQYLLLGGKAALKNIAVDDLAAQPLLRLSSLRAEMAAITPLTGEFHLSKLLFDVPELYVRRNNKGEINLLALVPPKKEESPEQKETPAPARAPEPEGGYKTAVDIDAFLVEKGVVHFEDGKPAEPLKLSLKEIEVTGQNLSTAPGKEGTVVLTLTLPKRGSAGISGPVSLNPLSAKLAVAVERMDLPLFQTYIGDVLNVELTGGKIGTRGRLALNTVNKELKTRYTGRVFLTRFSCIDTHQANDLLKWSTLYLNDVDIGYNPLYVHIRQIALSDFYSRIIMRQDGTLNLQHLIREKQEEQDAGKQEMTKDGEKSAKPGTDKKETQDIRIGAMTLQGGEIDFLDQSISPNFSERFLEMGGRVSGLSSAENTRGDVVLRGKLDGYAPLEITGQINPLKKDLYVDLKASFHNMDLSPVTPYAGKYIGYEIQKGKLSFDLNYHIDRRKLNSTNVVFLDQLNLGDKVDSPDATKLPVSLAIALLKDRHGQIKLDIPVSGTLDDPEFSVWRIIVKILVNLLSKAATAPFALLGSLFGGGEELSYVEFDYGKTVLGEESLKKIVILSKALSDRPSLKIDLEGYVDAERDREGMKKMAFDRKVKVQKMNDLIRTSKGEVKLEDVVIGEAEYEKYLRKAYDTEKFPKPRNIIGLAKKLPVVEMEKLIYTHLEVKDDDLRLLAGQRVTTVREALLAAGEVTAERIFIVETKYLAPPVKEKLKKSRVDFRLK